MHRSTDHILTTHTGSLPRPEALTQLYVKRSRGEPVDGVTFEDARPVLRAVSENVMLEIQKTFDFFKATAASDRIDRIIVSGGRGVGGPEGFAPVRELAQVLGGALGASRAAVDAVQCRWVYFRAMNSWISAAAASRKRAKRPDRPAVCTCA